mgnify:FL=1
MEAQAALFRAQRPMQDVDPAWDQLIGMKLPPPFKTPHTHPQGPVFTHMNDNNFPNLYRDDKMVVYLNAAPPMVEQYPGKEERAGMSFVHLLACPRERIYNEKTLLATDYALVAYMYEKVNELMSTQDFREKVAYQLWCQCVELLKTQDQRVEFLRNLTQLRMATDQRDMGYYFHSHPNHSVGHLHMHCINKNMLTKAFELNSHKNVPIEMVLQRILSMA